MKKLKLNKETIRNLSASELRGVAGGGFTDPGFCPTLGQGNTCRTSVGNVCHLSCSCPFNCPTAHCNSELPCPLPQD